MTITMFSERSQGFKEVQGSSRGDPTILPGASSMDQYLPMTDIDLSALDRELK
jgi:hypothetical protein